MKKIEITVHSFPALKRVKFSYLSGLPDKTVDNHSFFFPKYLPSSYSIQDYFIILDKYETLF